MGKNCISCQFLVTFTAYGWYLYLTVPAYVLYKGGMFVREYLLSRSGGEEVGLSRLGMNFVEFVEENY